MSVKPDWLMTRVVVVLIAVFVPVYFFILVYLLPFLVAPFDSNTMNLYFHYLVVPSVFSATWVLLIYFNRYRLANTVHLMQETTTAVPLRWRLFYGLNAAFVLMFFILPLVTAPLAIIGGFVVAANVFYNAALGRLGKSRIATLFAVLIAIALCILPFIITIEFIPNYLDVWNSILSSWTGLGFTVVYGVAQCLVNALSFGAPVHFIYYAAEEYDRGLYGQVYTKTPSNKIRIGQAVLFLIFTVLYLPPIQTPFGVLPFADMSWLFTGYINWVSLGIVAIMVLVRRYFEVEEDTTLGSSSNILVVGLFLVVEIFFKTDLLIVTIVIWLAFLLFAAVIIANYVRASSREMY
ncbi:hypothetical protein EU546_02700 [Candidatus Thorarchaeota archaeon]|nr:MAG: hypothetical protein EU546_02700 [Candidatus Thorarchaeota archaeon]